MKCGADILQEGSVAGCRSNVLQQLDAGGHGQVCRLPVEEPVAGAQRVFIDAARGFDQARLIKLSSVTAFTFIKTHVAKNSWFHL